jgi:hypothetical protein
MLGRKQKQTKSALTFRLIVNVIMEELERESEKSNVRAFTVSIGDPVKWDSNPGTLATWFLMSRQAKKSKITTTHIIWWTQCQCNTISSSSVVMTKSNQIKKIKWTLSNLRYRAAATNNWWCFEQYQPSFLQNSW